MNIPRLLGYKWISITFTIFAINMCFSNLVVISPRDHDSSAHRPTLKAQCIHGDTIGPWPTYTRQQLLEIRNMVKQNTRYCTIPFETINLVRKYKINKCPSRLECSWAQIRQSGSQQNNLVNIEIKARGITVSQHIRIATVNTRSIKNKVDLVLENSELENLDFLAITETWLNDTDEHRAWIMTSQLESEKYSFHTHNRLGKRGRGLGLLHRKEYQVTKIDNPINLDTLEYAVWTAQPGKQHITLLGIYYPPLGSTGNTHTRFLDQVSELLQLVLTNHKNLVILGDFNIAIQDLGNPDSKTYRDTMIALGLTQHINQATHNQGNILDHIYTESIDTLGVMHSFIEEYISDHRLVGIEINKKKIPMHLDNQPRRQFKN